MNFKLVLYTGLWQSFVFLCSMDTPIMESCRSDTRIKYHVHF